MEKHLSRMISCIKIEFIADNTTRTRQEKHCKVAAIHSDTQALSPNQNVQSTVNESDKVQKLNTIMYVVYIMQIPSDERVIKKAHSHT